MPFTIILTYGPVSLSQIKRKNEYLPMIVKTWTWITRFYEYREMNFKTGHLFVQIRAVENDKCRIQKERDWNKYEEEISPSHIYLESWSVCQQQFSVNKIQFSNLIQKSLCLNTQRHLSVMTKWLYKWDDSLSLWFSSSYIHKNKPKKMYIIRTCWNQHIRKSETICISSKKELLLV